MGSALFIWLAICGDLYAIQKEGSVFQSTNGVTWDVKQNVGDFKCIAITMDGTNLYAFTQDGSIYKSTDNGNSWVNPKSCGMSDVVDGHYSNGWLFVLSEGGSVARSNDGGSTWSYSSCGQTGVISITTIQDALFIVSKEGLVFKSINGGASWTQVSSIQQEGARAITGTSDNELWVITETGLLTSSTTYGANWSAFSNTGLNTSDIVDITADESDALFVLSRASGVAKYTAKGWAWIGNTGQFDMEGIVGKAGEPFAIGITGFMGAPGNARIKLIWWVEVEKDIKQYILERKVEEGFHKISTKLASGANQYEYTDEGLTNGETYFYRLGWLNNQGLLTYYDTIQVTLGVNPIAYLSLIAYPNPFTSQLNVRCMKIEIGKNKVPETITHIGPLKLKVYNSTGELVTEIFSSSSPLPTSALPVTTYWKPHKLASGVYILSLEVKWLGELNKTFVYISE